MQVAAEASAQVETTGETASATALWNRTISGGKASLILPLLVHHQDDPSHQVPVYAMLDSQSDTCFISETILESLGVAGHRTSLCISTMTDERKIVETSKVTGLSVCGLNETTVIPLPTTYSRKKIPANRAHIPTPDMALKWQHLDQVHDKLTPLQDIEVGILIGYNCPRALVPREVIPPVEDGPYAQRTDLGWGIIGVFDDNVEEGDEFGVSHNIIAQIEPPGKAFLSRQFSIKERIMEYEEDVGLSIEDNQFLSIMDAGCVKSAGKFEMPLPFRKDEPTLADNYVQAVTRLAQLKKRLLKDKTFKEDYLKFMEDMISQGYAEKVSENGRLGSVWYIPHHGIYHPKRPDKIRVVFDCAAQYRGHCLNKELLQGPDLMNSLVGVLIRFRQDPVAFSCDIKKMFFQFRVTPTHRDYLRFLWWDDNNLDADPVEYRMTVHLFGATSSPAVANYGLRRVAMESEDEEVISFMTGNFYVDDGLKSVSTAIQAKSLIERTQQACAANCLRLHKFISNNQVVLEDLPKEDLAIDPESLQLDDLPPIERVLGLEWNIELDAFCFRMELRARPTTRRGILSTIHSIFDPLGFIAPVVLTGKLILQELCKLHYDWDSPLPEALDSKWTNWKRILPDLQRLQIPRWFRAECGEDVKCINIHHFSDASNVAYGQCSYVEFITESGSSHFSLVCAKCRVAPLKTLTIPRLELTAAVLSVQQSLMLRREISYPIDQETFWCDSKVVLGYINNSSRRFKVFVANRIQFIRNYTDPNQWKYVPTEENPADCISRGLNPDQLGNHNLWWTGPQFMKEGRVESTVECIPDVSPDDSEVKVVHRLEAHQTDQAFDLSRLDRFSSWHSLKKAIAVCLRYKKLIRAHLDIEKRDASLSVEELDEAEKQIFKLVQSHHFSAEIESLKSQQECRNGRRKPGVRRSSPIYKLNPFLDEDGVMRVGGRISRSNYDLKEIHPIILPKMMNCHMTKLVIREAHVQAGHQSRGMTLNKLRSSGVWIVGLVSAVSTYIRQCVQCRRLYSAPESQKMADLPEDRVVSDNLAPFDHCGVDYFGPWLVKDGRKEVKRYGVLFTCLNSRAVHIETANSLTTDAFINALRRFEALRGPIRLLRCDRGTNFVGAEAELTRALTEMDQPRIQDYLLQKRCDYFPFRMNRPCSSHAGGVWERQIRSVRRVISNLLQEFGSQLDDESLRTLLTEAAALVNSRPLSVENLADPTAVDALTPNHLITMKTKVLLPPPGDFVREDVFSRKRWRRVQYLLNQFWLRWRKEYLQNLQVRTKWNSSRRNVKNGDVVLIKDDNVIRAEWLLARVEEAYLSEDGHVRSVKVRLANRHLNSQGKPSGKVSYLERPIQKIVLLVED